MSTTMTGGEQWAVVYEMTVDALSRHPADLQRRVLDYLGAEQEVTPPDFTKGVIDGKILVGRSVEYGVAWVVVSLQAADGPVPLCKVHPARLGEDDLDAELRQLLDGEEDGR